jgi:hypothetical protein
MRKAAITACTVVVLLLVVGRLDVRRERVELDVAPEVPPGARLLADALRDVAKSEEGNAEESKGKGSKAAARAPDGASVHAVRETALERMAMAIGMREKMTPLASMPRHRFVVDASSLPSYGSRAWKLAKAKADVRVSALQLTVDKEQRRFDEEGARYSKLYKGPVGAKLQSKEQLEARVKREVATAQAMEARARKMSDNVVQDLNVKKGHIDIKQWYRSQAAFKSSQESTEAVKDAKKLWAKAMADREALHTVSTSSYPPPHPPGCAWVHTV